MINIGILLRGGSLLYLKGAKGYSHGVGLLDAICEKAYANSSYKNVQIRSLKMEDMSVITNRARNELMTSTSATVANYWELEINISVDTLAEGPLPRNLFSSAGYRSRLDTIKLYKARSKD